MLTFKLAILILKITYVYGEANCAQMEPICSSDVISFDAVHSNNLHAEPGNNYGCLEETDDPSWFYLEIESSGDIYMDLRAEHDIDFIIYGPYSNLLSAQATCGNMGHGTNQNNNNNNKIIHCGYSRSPIESPTIMGAHVGQVYAMLISNFAKKTQTITLTLKTHSTGATDCGIVPTKSPTIATDNPTVATNNPTLATIAPTLATSTPTSITSSPTPATSNPTSATSNPTVSTANPTATTYNPTLATANPTPAPICPSTIISTQQMGNICGSQQIGELQCTNVWGNEAHESIVGCDSQTHDYLLYGCSGYSDNSEVVESWLNIYDLQCHAIFEEEFMGQAIATCCKFNTNTGPVYAKANIENADSNDYVSSSNVTGESISPFIMGFICGITGLIVITVMVCGIYFCCKARRKYQEISMMKSIETEQDVEIQTMN